MEKKRLVGGRASRANPNLEPESLTFGLHEREKHLVPERRKSATTF